MSVSVDPSTGEVWPNEDSLSQCDSETQEAYSAAGLFDNEIEAELGEAGETSSLYLSDLATFTWPNPFIADAVFGNMVREGVALLHRNHESFDQSYLAGGAGNSRADMLKFWRDFFVKWLGAVPADVLPSE